MKKNNRYNALNKERKKANLTFGMIRLLVICLVVPFGALSVVLFFSSASKTSNQVRNTVVTSMENAAENCNSNIEKVIQESKQASYDNVIRTSYLQFLEDKNEAVMYREISSYLSEKYKYNSMISSAIVVFKEKTTMEYYTYSNVAGATYASISDFKNNAMTQIKSVAQRMGTNTKFIEIGEHLYLVRNLVTSDYNPYAIIVMEINKSNMFKSMDNVVWRENGAIFLDGDMVCEPDYENDINNEKFKIYLSALTQLNLDDHNRIPTTDLRLIRRIVRDNQFRGHTAEMTINGWPSVRRGEEKNIFPYQEQADVMFNTACVYELSLLKAYAKPLLEQIDKTSEAYIEAKRLLKLLQYFVELDDLSDIPPTAIIREFIGGSKIVH